MKGSMRPGRGLGLLFGNRLVSATDMAAARLVEGVSDSSVSLVFHMAACHALTSRPHPL